MSETASCPDAVMLPPLDGAMRTHALIQSATIPERMTPREVLRGMRHDYRRLEPLDACSSLDSGPSAMTICTPVALMQEDQSTIEKTVEAISTSQQKLGRPVDLILWTNTQAELDEEGFYVKEDNAEIENKYAALRETLSPYIGSAVRVQTALEIWGIQPKMSYVRRNFMGAVAYDAYFKRYQEDHPVLWLDADTTYVAQDTLAAINHSVRGGDTLFSHAMLRYTTEWADGIPVSERDDATKAVMVNEMYRRRVVANKRPDLDRLTYQEESGLAFSIGTYLKLGGVKAYYEHDESSVLMKDGKQLLLEGVVTYREGRRMPKQVPGLIEYVQGARIGVSARRVHDYIRRYGISGVHKSERGNYRLFTQNDSEDPVSTDGITRADMHDLIESNQLWNRLALYGEKAEFVDDKDMRILNRVIDQLFENEEATR